MHPIQVARRRIAKSTHRHIEAIMCRAAAFPLLIGIKLFPERYHPSMLVIGQAYARHYWHPRRLSAWVDIVTALLLWPLGVLIAAAWFTFHNGRVVALRSGRSVAAQFWDQLRLAVTTGLLPGWYYIFELYRPNAMERARAYLTRGSTKRGIYKVIAKSRGSASPLSNKQKFAEFCLERQIPTIPLLFSAENGVVTGSGGATLQLPHKDLFVKPVRARGGRGAERWDYRKGHRYQRIDGEILSASQFLDRLSLMSQQQPYVVQERVRNHPAVADLSNGALSTLRIISCLDEHDRPEVMAAVQRMSVGCNVTVDNVHAGGLAAPVGLEDGRLGKATDMGIDAHNGWITHHPDTGARIEGRTLPMWREVLALVRRAHGAFNDWLVIGWDVAILADGPRIVEGNCKPDVDLIQRPLGAPFGDGRFGQLLAFHLQHATMPPRQSALLS